MKKNIRLSETELVDLIRKVIYEQSTIATGTKIIQGPAGDPYEYKREGGKYYTRKPIKSFKSKSSSIGFGRG